MAKVEFMHSQFRNRLNGPSEPNRGEEPHTCELSPNDISRIDLIPNLRRKAASIPKNGPECKSFYICQIHQNGFFAMLDMRKRPSMTAPLMLTAMSPTLTVTQEPVW